MVLGDEGRLAVERGGGCGEEVCPSVSLAPGRAGVVGVVEVVEARLDARGGGGEGGTHSRPEARRPPARCLSSSLLSTSCLCRLSLLSMQFSCLEVGVSMAAGCARSSQAKVLEERVVDVTSGCPRWYQASD